MKKIKILHFSTHDEDCGIGKYQEMFLAILKDVDVVENKFFDTSPNKFKVMPESEINKTLGALKKELKNYDILHVQHEFSFYNGDGFRRVCEVAGQLHKKLIITAHTSPNIAHTKPVLGGVGPRSVVRYLKAQRREMAFNSQFTDAMKLADMIIVHNDVTKDALVELGVDASVVRKLVIPVPTVEQSATSTLIAEKLHVKQGDIVYGMVGFLHRFKGLKEAIKALTILPDNYKLAIIGGIHAYSDAVEFYDEITDLVVSLNLQDRVYITGYIEDDDMLNALVRECDLTVYPYDRYYYSNVSSAALNNAFANYRPVVAYPTKSFIEIAALTEGMVLTQTFSYYELARSIIDIDAAKTGVSSKQFSKDYSYKNVSKTLVEYYSELTEKTL